MATQAASQSATAAKTTVRRHDLDWLRVLAVYGLIPFHVAIIFTSGRGDYVKNAQHSATLEALAGFVSFWGIPLLFVVAGASSWFALASRTRRQYVAERLKRLVVPFVLGVLLVVPLQVYYGRLSDPRFHQSYLEFYPRFLAAFAPEKGPEYWAHLWFVPVLLAFSLITLPLFYHLRTEPGKRLIARFAAACERPGVVLLLGVPLGLCEAVLHSDPATAFIGAYPPLSMVTEFIFFLIFFIYGYLLYTDRRVERAIVRHGLLAMILGFVCLLIVRGMEADHVVTSYAFTPAYVAYMFLRGFVSWLWVLGIVSLAMRLLTFTNRLLEHLNDSFYPVYVLHMLVLTVIGFYVVRWQADIWVKYAVIVVATLIVTVALYDALIRWNNVTRFLFGLKPLAQDARRNLPDRARRAPVPRAMTRHERSVHHDS
jgi:glucan biosynthesis protein C